MAARSGGSRSGSKVSTCKEIRLNIGTPKFTVPPERSTAMATPDDLPAVCANDVHGLLNAPPFGDHVLHDQDLLAGGNLESAPQRQFALLLLDKDEPQAQLPGHFLAEHQPAHGRRDDRHRAQRPNLARQFRAELLDDRHLLQGQRALEVLAAVQSAAEHEMAFQQRAALAENLQDFVPGHAAMVRAAGKEQSAK